MPEINLLDLYPKSTRPIDERAQISYEDRIIVKRLGKEYFDGTRVQGYGGYYYDGRWKPIAKRFKDFYGLTSHSRVLDIGCAKGFLLHDLLEAVPGIQICGLDISEYVLNTAIETAKPHLILGNAKDLPFADKSFDLIICINSLHNILELDEVKAAISEIERVSRSHKFISVGAYQNKEEKERLDRWAVVAKVYMHRREWVSLFQDVGYSGDYYWFNP